MATSAAGSLSTHSTTLFGSEPNKRLSSRGSGAAGAGSPRGSADGEHAAAPRPGAHRHRVLQHLGDAVDDGEAEPEAGRRLLIFGAASFELLEDELQLILRNADAGVPDFHDDAAAAPAAAQQHFPAARVAQGVRQEVLQDAAEKRRVCHDNGVRRCDSQLQPALCGDGLKRSGDARQQRMDVHGSQLRAQRAGIQLRDVEQRLQQLIDHAERLVQLIQQRCGFAGVTPFAESAGEDARYVQWLQQVVARGGEEAGLAYVCGFRCAFGFRELLVQQRELARALGHAPLQKLVGLANVALAGLQRFEGLDLRRDVRADEHETAGLYRVDLELEHSPVLQALLERFGRRRELRFAPADQHFRELAIATHVLTEHDVHRCADLRLVVGNVQQLEKAAIPGCEPPLPVEHPDALRYVLERRAKQVVIEQDRLGSLGENSARAADVSAMPLQRRCHHDVRGGRADGAAQESFGVRGEILVAIRFDGAGERARRELRPDEACGETLQVIEAVRAIGAARFLRLRGRRA